MLGRMIGISALAFAGIMSSSAQARTDWAVSIGINVPPPVRVVTYEPRPVVIYRQAPVVVVPAEIEYVRIPPGHRKHCKSREDEYRRYESRERWEYGDDRRERHSGYYRSSYRY